MFESISCERPRPTGLPNFSRIWRPPTRRSSQVFGPVRVPDLAPEVDAVVAGIRDERVGEREVLAGLRIERRLLRERDHLPVPALDLVDDLPVVDDLLLVRGRRRDEEEEVVSLLRRGLGRAARVDLGRRHVIDDDLGPVLRAPLLRVDAVEPGVVAGHEVAPLQDPERLLRRRSPSSREGPHESAGTAPAAMRRSRRFQEPAPRDPGALSLRHRRVSSPRHGAGAPGPKSIIPSRGRPRPGSSLPEDHAPRRVRRGGRSEARRRDALRRLQDDLPDLRADLALPRADPEDRRGRRVLDRRRDAGRSGQDEGLRRAARHAARHRSTTATPGRPPTPSASSNVPTLFRVGADGTIAETVVGFDRARLQGLAGRAAALAGKPAPELFRRRRPRSRLQTRLRIPQRRQVAGESTP